MKKVQGRNGGYIVNAEKGETSNPNGRPRKTIGQVNKDLEKQGYKAATATEIADCYLRLINLDVPKLKEMITDTGQPALIRVVGKLILEGKKYDIIEKVLDRAIGRAVQQMDVNDITPIIKITQEQKDAIDNL